MPPEASAAETPSDSADLAKAFQELAKGESTASAMETQLTALERKIDALLASADEQDETTPSSADDGSADRHRDAKA